MKKVTKINPIIAETPDKPKLRVAAYCRVSTDSDDQLLSLDAQIKHYESYIIENSAWEYVGLYYDKMLLKMIQKYAENRVNTASCAWFSVV